MSAGTLQLASTLCATEPSTMLPKPPIPREPMTMSENFPLAASEAIVSPASPKSFASLNAMPFADSARRAGASAFSAWSR